jgi:hypothetical protein
VARHARFGPYIDMIIPDEGGAFFDQATLDDIFKVEEARSRMVMLKSESGGKIELQAPEKPVVEGLTRGQLGYGSAGPTEIALEVQDIDAWFDKIRAAGYETQTEYVWAVGGGRLKSFLSTTTTGASSSWWRSSTSRRGADVRGPRTGLCEDAAGGDRDTVRGHKHEDSVDVVTIRVPHVGPTAVTGRSHKAS